MAKAEFMCMGKTPLDSPLERKSRKRIERRFCFSVFYALRSRPEKKRLDNAEKTFPTLTHVSDVLARTSGRVEGEDKFELLSDETQCWFCV
jgi:hypothetical protein